MTSDPTTIAVYDEAATRYLDGNSADWEYHALADFIARLPTSAHVLDLGCGPGHHAARMIAAGLSVDAIDASSGMVALAREKFDIPARQAQFSEIDAPASYDGVWANFSLLHAPRDEMPAHLARIHTALRPGGVFHIGFKVGSGEGRDSLNRFYTWWEVPEMRLALETAGFIVDDTVKRGRGVGLDSSPFGWALMTAVKGG